MRVSLVVSGAILYMKWNENENNFGTTVHYGMPCAVWIMWV
jgi:hypothetical protein